MLQCNHIGSYYQFKANKDKVDFIRRFNQLIATFYFGMCKTD